jgi:formylglycine-generating enzyme required for sulfatase activity
LLLAIAMVCTGCRKTKPDAKVEVQQNHREMVVHLGHNVTMRLMLLPAGQFKMGSPDAEEGRGEDEGPVRLVTLSKPFYIAVTEVTQDQYEAVMSDNPSTFEGGANPVEEVSWEKAVAFCEKLSSISGKTFRLPTEAEWEYACRAGTRTAYCRGDRQEDLMKVGWFCFDATVVKTTRPAASLQANPWGLYDMHGNIWEWCSDWYAEDYYAARNNQLDPIGPTTGTERILRGGSWSDDPEDCRSAYRESQPPDYADDDIGFRIVCQD